MTVTERYAEFRAGLEIKPLPEVNLAGGTRDERESNTQSFRSRRRSCRHYARRK